MEGWIKLHRKILKNWIWDNELYLKLWIDCLFRASYETKQIRFDNKFINLEVGEFITSYEKFALHNHCSIRNVRTFFRLLTESGQIIKKSTSKATKITILKYAELQGIATHQTTNERQTSDKPVTTNKEVKNKRNKEIKENTELFNDQIFSDSQFKEVWDKWTQFRKEIKKPLTPTTIEFQLKQLKAVNISTAIKMIEQSIEKGWSGIFEIKELKNGKTTYLPKDIDYSKQQSFI